MSDDLGDRMKMYEGVEAQRRLMPRLPAMARLDGRSFSRFTCGLDRPFDPRLTGLMLETTRDLVAATNACAGYCQSDEITLAWYSTSPKSQIFFDGRIQKMTSVLAAMATLEFNRALSHWLPSEYSQRRPVFDCRVWAVPTIEEGANVFLWRQQDAVKNSIASAAQRYFSHNQLLNKSTSEMQEMLFSLHEVNWNDYPSEFKRGTFVQRHTVKRAFTAEEIDRLPPRHAARTDPNLIVERTAYLARDLWLSRISNRAEVLFLGAEPIEEPRE